MTTELLRLCIEARDALDAIQEETDLTILDWLQDREGYRGEDECEALSGLLGRLDRAIGKCSEDPDSV